LILVVGSVFGVDPTWSLMLTKLKILSFKGPYTYYPVCFAIHSNRHGFKLSRGFRAALPSQEGRSLDIIPYHRMREHDLMKGHVLVTTRYSISKYRPPAEPVSLVGGVLRRVRGWRSLSFCPPVVNPFFRFYLFFLKSLSRRLALALGVAMAGGLCVCQSASRGLFRVGRGNIRMSTHSVKPFSRFFPLFLANVRIAPVYRTLLKQLFFGFCPIQQHTTPNESHTNRLCTVFELFGHLFPCTTALGNLHFYQFRLLKPTINFTEDTFSNPRSTDLNTHSKGLTNCAKGLFFFSGEFHIASFFCFGFLLLCRDSILELSKTST
jgi:hypothetical protein